MPQDHATIQAAIDAARSGDTVRVAPGRYAGRLKLGGNGASEGVIEGNDVRDKRDDGLELRLHTHDSGPALTIVMRGNTFPAVSTIRSFFHAETA